MAAFYSLFVMSIVRYLRHRHPLELAVVLVFMSTAALFAINLINPLLPAIAPILGPIGVTLLVAQPALMMRLVALIVPLKRWVVPLAFAGCAVSVAWFYAISTSLGARNGLLVKDRLALERARTLDTVIFDKTGTLTRGEPALVDASDWSPTSFLARLTRSS